MSDTVAYLLLGSNLGDRVAHLQHARTELAATAGEIVAASALYETAAWGVEDQPAFLNQVLAVRTPLAAPALSTLIFYFMGRKSLLLRPSRYRIRRYPPAALP